MLPAAAINEGYVTVQWRQAGRGVPAFVRTVMKHLRGPGVVLGLLICASATGSAQSADEQMKKDIEALKEGQQAIQKDLAEIKRLLLSRPVAAADALPRDPVAIAGDPFKGNGTAKVAVIEFSDYQCPFCSRYTKDVLPQIRTDYVETGKIKYVFRDMPLSFHKNAFKAAEAAHCAGLEGKFWEMHDTLFATQSALAPEQLAALAKTVGVDEARFQQCLDSGRFATEINKDIADAGSAGITGTPSFLIGVIQPGDGRVKVVKKLVGAKPYAEFKAAIDDLLVTP
jgi:protein-disulfide isomerase